MLKIVFLDAATLGETPLDEIAAQGELVCYPFSTPERRWSGWGTATC